MKVLLAAAAPGAATQGADPLVSPRSVGIGPTLAVGIGPTVAAANSLGAFLDLTLNMRLRAEAGHSPR